MTGQGRSSSRIGKGEGCEEMKGIGRYQTIGQENSLHHMEPAKLLVAKANLHCKQWVGCCSAEDLMEA